MSTSLNPKRTVAELKELRALTGDENGAQRVARRDSVADRFQIKDSSTDKNCCRSRREP